MKSILFLALAIFMIAFNSCKESDNDEPFTSPPRIKTMTGLPGNIISFEYDDSGRLSKRQSVFQVENFNYLSDTMIIVETKNIGLHEDHLIITDTLLLNDQGLVISRRLTEELAFGYILFRRKSTFTYEYDSNGYRIKSSEEGNSTFEISDGNTIKKVIHQVDSTGDTLSYEIVNYQFTPSSSNTIGNENRGISFYGKQDKNLQAGYQVDVSNSAINIYGLAEPNYTCEYEFDNHHRVIKETIHHGDRIFSTAYTYYD